MNERIRELWDKAAESTAAFPSGQNNSWETQVNFMEKFAELIVRECMDVVEKQLGGGNGDGVEWDRAIDFTYEDMKRHFGVE